MISLSIFFHIASAIAFGVILLAYIKTSSKIQFLRNWITPGMKSVLVLEIDKAFTKFSEAFAIELIKESDLKHLPPARVRFSNLVDLHRKSNIKSIKIFKNQGIQVELTVNSIKDLTVPAVSQLGAEITKDFSNEISVTIKQG